VARAAAAGKSNREIAAELYISVMTVEFHLGQILARLDLDSRNQIADALGAPGAAELPTESPTADG
jgi:DNA-binding CsgD family transcriptional regulator